MTTHPAPLIVCKLTACFQPRCQPAAARNTNQLAQKMIKDEGASEEEVLVGEDVVQKPAKLPRTSIWDTTDDHSDYDAKHVS